MLADVRENRVPGDTAVPPLLGARCRATAAGPFRDGTQPRWKPTIDYAVQALERVSLGYRAGQWTPTPAERHALRVLVPAQRAIPDSPPVDGIRDGDAAWIQRLVHLAHTTATIRAIRDHNEGDLAPLRLFGIALAALGVALTDVGDTAHDLETKWAHRDEHTGITRWERVHVPVPLRAHITALEALTAHWTIVAFELTTDPDELH